MMVADGIKLDAIAESGKNLVNKHQIKIFVENERVDVERDGRPVSRDQIFRRERGQGNIIFLCSATTSSIGNLTLL